jgi:hypothetical protein
MSADNAILLRCMRPSLENYLLRETEAVFEDVLCPLHNA